MPLLPKGRERERWRERPRVFVMVERGFCYSPVYQEETHSSKWCGILVLGRSLDAAFAEMVGVDAAVDIDSAVSAVAAYVTAAAAIYTLLLLLLLTLLLLIFDTAAVEIDIAAVLV